MKSISKINPAIMENKECLGNISSIKSAPASSVLTLVSHRSYNTRTANHRLCGSGERNKA